MKLMLKHMDIGHPPINTVIDSKAKIVVTRCRETDRLVEQWYTHFIMSLKSPWVINSQTV